MNRDQDQRFGRPKRTASSPDGLGAQNDPPRFFLLEACLFALSQVQRPTPAKRMPGSSPLATIRDGALAVGHDELVALVDTSQPPCCNGLSPYANPDPGYWTRAGFSWGEDKT